MPPTPHTAHTPAPPTITLRPPTPADLPALYDMQLDPEANRLAGTHPRSRESFEALWAGILSQQAVGPSSTLPPTFARIITDRRDQVLGSINIFPLDEGRGVRRLLGYWIHRDHWGRGIAGRAIALMLESSPHRPLFAVVAAHNTASLRALGRNGFTIIAREHAPATERYTAGEIVTLSLL